MINAFISYLALYGINSNIVASNGVGAVEFQREKMYPLFEYLNALFLIIGIAISAILTYTLNRFLFVPYGLEFVKFGVVVTFAGLFNLLVSFVWKKVSNFYNYLYENSFSYAFDTVYTVFVVMTMEMSVEIAPFLMSVFAVAIVVVLGSAIIGFFVRAFNRGYMNANFRNVPTRLFFVSIISMILYYLSFFIV